MWVTGQNKVVYATYRHIQGIKVNNTLAMAILYLAKVFLTKLYTHCNSFVTSPFYLCL